MIYILNESSWSRECLGTEFVRINCMLTSSSLTQVSNRNSETTAFTFSRACYRSRPEAEIETENKYRFVWLQSTRSAAFTLVINTGRSFFSSYGTLNRCELVSQATSGDVLLLVGLDCDYLWHGEDVVSQDVLLLLGLVWWWQRQRTCSSWWTASATSYIDRRRSTSTRPVDDETSSEHWTTCQRSSTASTGHGWPAKYERCLQRQHNNQSRQAAITAYVMLSIL